MWPILACLALCLTSAGVAQPPSTKLEELESRLVQAKGQERLMLLAEIAEHAEAPARRATELGIEALGLLTAQGDKTLELRLRLTLAQRHILGLGEYDLGLVHSLRAENLARDLDDDSARARAIILRADALYFSSDYRAALAAADEALRLYTALGDARGTGSAWWQKGTSYSDLGDHAKAVDAYSRAVHFFEEAGNEVGVPGVLYSIGVSYLALERLDQAQEITEQALEGARQAESKVLEALIVQLLGNILREQGQPAEGLVLLRQAHAEILRIDLQPNYVAEALEDLGDTLLVLGEHQEAESHLRRSLELYEQIGNRFEIASVLLSLGKVHNLRGEHNAATSVMHQALEISEEIESKSRRAEVLSELSKTYAATGRYRDALETLRRHESLEREILNEKSERDLNALQTHLDLARREDRIEHLEREQALASLELERQRAVRLALLLGFGALLSMLLLLFNRYRLKSRQKLLADTVRQEREASARLREIDQLKDEFLANTSHELRTPLYGMIGLLETLRDDPTKTAPEARPILDTVLHSGRRLSSLVNDILDFAKLRRHGLELALEPVELRVLTDVVLTLSKPLAQGRKLELVNAVEPDLPPVRADEARVQQILHNLVGNAIKFTDEGRIEVRAEVLEGELLVRVSDSGIGISAEDSEQIFEPFIQADASAERAHGGTGLGLAVSRQLVELHGGRLEVESQPGVGSDFSFTLPLAEPGTTPKRTAGEPPSPSTKGSPDLESPSIADLEDQPVAILGGGGIRSGSKDTRSTILTVDDEPVERQVIGHHLEPGGYRLLSVADGAKALEVLTEESIDLVLLDVMMPRMSGYEVCRAIRASRSREELPVIFLSAKNRSADRVAGFEVGGNDYLAKPIAKRELLARVEAHLELLDKHRGQVEENHALRGLLPICCRCKKVRHDNGYWEQVEVYVARRSEAEFSHGICPDCVTVLYPDLEGVADAQESSSTITLPPSGLA